MERLTIDEVIEHCKRKTVRYEQLNGKAELEQADISLNFIKEYWEHRQVAEWLQELKSYRDAEEQGLLLRLNSKDELIEVLANKLLNSEFGRCYMCTNPMKNITLDGVNNGCDGGCNTSEEFTVDDFLKKIISEMEYKKRKRKLAEQMKGV